MKLYHASPVRGLTRLEPRVSTHQQAYVYAVADPVTALLFGVKQDDFDFIISTEDHPVVYECYPNAFAARYQGKSCSLYQVDETGFQSGLTSWSVEYVSRTSAEVLQEQQIDDLHAALLDYARQGQLTLRTYQDTPEYRSVVEAHVKDRLLRFHINLDECLHWPDERFRKHYAQLVQALKNRGGTEK